MKQMNVKDRMNWKIVVQVKLVEITAPIFILEVTSQLEAQYKVNY